MTEKTKTISKFEEVYNINVNEFTEKKNGLIYLSWAHAVREMTKSYPNWKYEVVKNENNIPAFGNPEIGYMVYTKITVNDETKEMWLPVLNFKNEPIKNPNIFQINTAVMRCLTKNTAMFGVGLYIYAGEDLPEEDKEKTVAEKLEKIFESPTKNIDREDQEKMHVNALNLINQSATLEKIDELVKKYHKAWEKTLDEDLYTDIKQAVQQARADITRENNKRNGDLI